MNIALPIIISCFPCADLPARPEEARDAPVAIHRVAGGGNLEEALKTPLTDLTLDPEPWLRPEDIAWYDSSARLIYLRENVRLPALTPDLRGTPFVLTAKGRRLFLGAFWTDISSFLPEGVTPIIRIPPFGSCPGTVALDLIMVERDGEAPAARRDPRDDPLLPAAFREAGRLREGIEVRLKRVEVRPRQGGAAVRYTYSMKNLGTDPLQLLDPDRMGGPLFHHFTNGVGLLMRGPELRIVWADLKGFSQAPPAGTEADLRWFAVLEPGKSIERTVDLPAYPPILPGRYEASFTFHGPLLRKRPPEAPGSPRIWLGEREAKATVEVK
jgi:hypothetical protein